MRYISLLRMESTAQSKSYLSLGILLSPIFLPFLGCFSIYSWRHRRGYKGPEEYTARYSFFKRVYWIISQYSRQENHLRMGDYLTPKHNLIVFYSPTLKLELLSISFLLSAAYKSNFQKGRSFKFCILTNSRPRWLFLLSSLEILYKIPSTRYLKESIYPLVCFTDSIDKLRKFTLESYKTVIFFRVESSYTWWKGTKREFQAIGSLNTRERLGNSAQIELKLDKIVELLS
ncbi:hypothetical protein [Candidatus Mycoplasma haematominutum]|uniref:Uncharacterized protein n=1 Tax=Candidatus Mycoplasma haematominutum 'Birmingham 1' TaxID=1116213 RepID=G8C3M4_9MOLU|nr:hypothetical protein [Candidatus Mycoplasma haematominutum]CCE66922.1 hypothetical protein (homolog to MSU_0723) [Candidatus Mycoplasma haematominutum 'Birmingham 1']